MRKRIFIAMVCLGTFCSARGDNFNMPSATFGNNARTITINSTKTSSDDINLSFDGLITGLGVSGIVTMSHKHSLVRILLIDTDDATHLIYENVYLKQFSERQIQFHNIAIETNVLKPTSVKSIKIIVMDAELHLDSITVVPHERKFSLSNREIEKCQSASREQFAIYMAKEWNENLRLCGMPWIADTTSISKLPYSQKKIILGGKDDYFNSYGLEYFVAGYFVYPNESTVNALTSTNSTDNYTECFDWRNRHGVNWLTPVKHQKQPNNPNNGNGGCWVFSAVGAVEAYVNLYYNQKLDLDLSEQEVGVCSNGGSLHIGGDEVSAIRWIKNNGIVDEACFEWKNDSTWPCSEKCNNPSEHIHISNISSWRNRPDSIYKAAIIIHGPQVSAFVNGHTNHAMCLCGYGIVRAHDTLHYIPKYQNPPIAPSFITIEENSEYIGKTYWIFKNSYGIGTWPDYDGYYCAIMENNSNFYCTSILGNVTSLNYSDSDIAVTDEDNDGYYFWGLGPKPSHCPVCCPDTPDGDDSNPQLAEMDSYGNFAPYVFPYPALTVSSDSTWNVNRTQCGNIIVTNNATLTITAELTMNPAAKIIVQDGGTVIVDAGSVVNATVDVQSSSKIILRNNGTLYLKRWGDLNVHLGAEADITYGRVLLQ